jgi:hypothetical protein
MSLFHFSIALPSIPMSSVSSLSFMLPHQNPVDIYLLSYKLNALLALFSQVSLHLIIIQCSLQIIKLLIMQTSAISISYKYVTCVCVCVRACVRACMHVNVCNLIVLCKVQSFVSGMLTPVGRFSIMSFFADITCQRWIAVFGKT